MSGRDVSHVEQRKIGPNVPEIARRVFEEIGGDRDPDAPSASTVPLIKDQSGDASTFPAASSISKQISSEENGVVASLPSSSYSRFFAASRCHHGRR